MTESIASLAKAYVAAQKEIENIRKNKNNPFFKSKYADLAAVLGGCREVLANHGLAVIQTTRVTEEGTNILVTTLVHESGESIEGEMIIRPMKADPQAMGSAMTYARRYAYSAMVGVAETDDDGHKGSETTPPDPDQGDFNGDPTAIPAAPETIRPSNAQLSRFFNLAKSNGWTDIALLDLLGNHFGSTETKSLTKATRGLTMLQYNEACLYVQENKPDDSDATVPF